MDAFYRLDTNVVVGIMCFGVGSFWMDDRSKAQAHEVGFISLYEAWATNLESLLLQSQ